MNLFKGASSKKLKEKSKEDKTIVKIKEEGFFEKIEKLEKLNDRLKADKIEADIISDNIKDIGKIEYCKLYSKTEKNPGTIVLEQENEDGDISQALYSPSDRYISITLEKAEDLRELYGEEIIEEKTIFSFDPLMIEKYGDILSKLIEESDEILDQDKEKIIKANISLSVSKGTIDMLAEYGKVSEVMESVKPVVSLKSIEIIKS